MLARSLPAPRLEQRCSKLDSHIAGFNYAIAANMRAPAPMRARDRQEQWTMVLLPTHQCCDLHLCIRRHLPLAAAIVFLLLPPQPGPFLPRNRGAASLSPTAWQQFTRGLPAQSSRRGCLERRTRVVHCALHVRLINKGKEEEDDARKREGRQGEGGVYDSR
jgi:hypothetical protein